MKKCTNCGQAQNDDVKFCFNCGGADFESAAEEGSYQQPYQQPDNHEPDNQQPYQQPVYQQPYQQPVYQQPYQPVASDSNQTVSVGMNFLFLLLAGIPIVNLIFAIVVAASSQKRSFKNLGIAWLILLAVQIILSIVAFFVIRQFVMELIDSIVDNINNMNNIQFYY